MTVMDDLPVLTWRAVLLSIVLGVGIVAAITVLVVAI